MTKAERSAWDSMVKRIVYDSRKQLSLYKEGKSGVHYVMLPLTDVIGELNSFTNTFKITRKNKKNV